MEFSLSGFLVVAGFFVGFLVLGELDDFGDELLPQEISLSLSFIIFLTVLTGLEGLAVVYFFSVIFDTLDLVEIMSTDFA